MTTTLLLTIPLLPALVSALLALRRPSPARAARLSVLAAGVATGAAGAAVASLAIGGGRWSAVLADGSDRAWIGLTADLTGALLAALAVAVGWVVQSFASRAMAGDRQQVRFHVLTGALAAATATVALAATIAVLVAAWIATSAVLVALVGLRRPWRPAADAASRTRRAAAVSDVALAAAGVALLVAGHGDLRSLDLADDGTAWTTAVALLVVVAGMARSALVPLHRWLPATIAAPTPVSALLHAGVVSGVGVLVLRLAPVVGSSATAMGLLFAVGIATAIVATTVALARADTKGALAWSTAGQMGFMAVQLAVGALAAALTHLLGHGMYKAALFLGAGGTTSAHRRARSLPIPVAPLCRRDRLVTSTVLPGAAVLAAMAVLEPATSAAGATVVAGFAWLTGAHLLNGWLRAVDRSPLAVVGAVGVGVVAPVTYVTMVTAFKAVLGDSLPAELAGAVTAPWLWATLGLVGAGALLMQTSAAAGLRQRLLAASVMAGAPSTGPAAPREPVTVAPITRIDLAPAVDEATLRAEVAAASRIAAPVWPLTSFVAVNPLGGFEHLDFADACAQARRWFDTATHLPVDQYRARHAAGELTDDHLRRALATVRPDLAEGTVRLRGARARAEDVVLRDLVDGPCAAVPDQLPREVDPVAAYVARWCASFVAGGGLALADRDRGFHRSWRDVVVHDRHLLRMVGPVGRARLLALPDDPAAALAAALRMLGVAPEERVDVLRALIARLPGWAGLARWGDEWAPADHTSPRLRVIDLLAVLASLDAAVGDHHLVDATTEIQAMQDERDLLGARVRHVLGGEAPAADREAITELLASLPEASRAQLWLAAAELAAHDRLLAALDRVDPGASPGRPVAQLVACIDVRSEVLRRHLEQRGAYETFGFAGFFGIPLAWQAAGAPAAEARCPVLVRPQHAATELEDHDGARRARASRAGARAAAHDAKASLAAPFALAEGAGWLLGPAAALRTLVPDATRRAWQAAVAAVTTEVDREVVVDMPLEQRVLFAEAVVRTIGLQRFAPLVVLCGHGSHTVNNPHASALDCGACGGAPGDASARVAAAVLNDRDIRSGLAARGIDIPDDTWFVAALHETTADRVTVLDQHLVPASHGPALASLLADLVAAAAQTAAERVRRLPDPHTDVATRGRDWAQVRPEWGLAGNTSMVIAPRSLTRDLDLGGRTFLHSYDPATDPDGVALETILTAPLVVAQWISMQYYASTVAPDVFGSGDKLLHNPVGGVGVLRGDGGDLAVGLPEQSVSFGGELAHDPVRLLAAVQAPLERIEAIVQRNEGLRDLVEHGWITLAARSHGHEPWSVRSAAGTWETWFPVAAPVAVAEAAVEPA